MTKYFTSDLHFNHKNVVRYCDRPWIDKEKLDHLLPLCTTPDEVSRAWKECILIDEMNEALMERWNVVVKPKDEVYLLGDLGFGSMRKLVAILERLNGRKYLIRGNHDYHCKRENFRRHFEWIRNYHELKIQDKDADDGKAQLLVLSHYPMLTWNKAGRGAIMVHGHSHNSLSEINKITRRIDIGVDNPICNYAPISYERVKEAMKDREYKVVDHHGPNKKA